LLIATCLRSVNVTFVDTRDIDAVPKERFHPFAAHHHMFPPGIEKNWYLKMKYYPSIEVIIICNKENIYSNKNYVSY